MAGSRTVPQERHSNQRCLWSAGRSARHMKPVLFDTSVYITSLLSVSKISSENIRPESHLVNEFNFDPSFVSSDKCDSQILGQGRYPSAKSDHRPELECTTYSIESTLSR